MRQDYPVRLLCQCFKVSSSGYYDWSIRKDCNNSHEEHLKVLVLDAHYRNRETYGAVRLHKYMLNNDQYISLWKVKQIRRSLGIVLKPKKQFVRTTDSKHGLPVAENVVEQKFQVSQANKVWCSDITYIPTLEGWLYLAGIKDVCTKEIVGFSMAATMHKELVIQALMNAVRQHKPPPGIVVHSDRGSQYCSHAYQDKLNHFGAICSMSRKGDCYDNAPMESFWGLLKNELDISKPYKTRLEAIEVITEYIVVFYNRQRIQAGLGYRSPAVFSKALKFQEMLLAA